MRDKLLRLLTGMTFACVAGPTTALASNNKAMDADIHSDRTSMGAHQVRRGRLAQPIRSHRRARQDHREPRPEISQTGRAADLGGHRDQRRGRHGRIR